MATLTRFSVQPLATMTRHLADVAAGRVRPDHVITGARLLSTYSERILPDREIWIAGGRIAALSQLRQAFETYDETGQRRRIGGDTPGKMEKRA